MKILQLVVAILIAQSAGIIGSIFTAPAIPEWYAQLEKPDFQPPDWIFGPVWVTLYTLIGIASYVIWRKRAEKPAAGKALFVYALHLSVNALWPVLFFGLREPGWAMVGIVLLWVMIAWVMQLFYRVDRRAAYLMIPYLLWVSYAALLNYAIWQMNK